DRRTARIAVRRPLGPIQDRLLQTVGRLANRMLPFPIVADRTVRMANYAQGSVEGCHSRSSLVSLRWLVPSAQYLAKAVACATPSVAIASLTPVRRRWTFKFKCLARKSQP